MYSTDENLFLFFLSIPGITGVGGGALITGAGATTTPAGSSPGLVRNGALHSISL